MANIIIKSEERKQAEAYVSRSFGANVRNAADREHVECIAARTDEAYKNLKRMEGNRK